MTAASVSFQAALRRASAELAAFGAWWLRELRDAWFALAERLASSRSQRVILELYSDRAILRKTHGNAPDELTECNLAAGTVFPALQEICPEHAPQQARAIVFLPASSVLLCSLRLPPVKHRDLARAVEFQLERELPVPRELLYVHWKVQETLPDGSRIVAVAIARRAYIDGIRNGIQSWGWRVVSIGLRSIEGEPAFDFLPTAAHALSFDVRRRDVYLWWSALALCLAYALVVTGQWWYERASLEPSLAQARARSQSISEREALLRTEGRPIASLGELMKAPSAADALVAMSTSVPQDAWIYQADIRASSDDSVSLTLEGYAPRSTALLEHLAESTAFENVELVETTSGGGELDRVSLKARLRAGIQK